MKYTASCEVGIPTKSGTRRCSSLLHMLRFGDEEVLLAAPPLLPALGRAVLPFVAAWPAAEPPQCMRDSAQARAGRAQLREARRSTVHVSAPAFPARSWSEGGAGEAHQHVDVAARSATQRFDAEIAVSYTHLTLPTTMWV